MNQYKERIEQLRNSMKNHGIDAYIVMTDDFHASEYVDDFFKGRQWLSGFTGSAGVLVITQENAGLWTDGRYYLQASQQLEGSGVKLFKSGLAETQEIPDFLKEHLKPNGVLGYDGRTVSTSYGDTIRKILSPLNISYKTDFDLLEEVWSDRPTFPANPIWLLDKEYSGKERSVKLKELREEMKKSGASALLITSLDDIAWLYNYRGNDILYTPVAMAYTIVEKEQATLYISQEAISQEIKDNFARDGVQIKGYFDVYDDVKKIYGKESSPKLMLDKDTVNETLVESVAHPVFASNPTTLAKSIKNETEYENFRIAHLKDGIALTKMIYQIKKMNEEGTIEKETELSIEKKLTAFRKAQSDFISLSFESIIASGDHGAIVHYGPTEESNRQIVEDTFLLMDTGAHYLQGTTDVTRTVSIGRITEEMKQVYTAVLMGNLNLGSVVFPKGTQGGHLDVLARKALWDMALDYNHGTGHGVGYLMNVHEGPNSIRKGSDTSGFGAVFQAGMITSNEPGCYLSGKYGIRTENLMLCLEAQEEDFLKFETLTLAPYDRASIKVDMLDSNQKKTLNDYHKKVYEKLSPYLSEEEAIWLKKETEEIQ